MAFDFSGNIDNTNKVDIDFGVIVCNILNKIINVKNKRHDSYQELLKYENNKIIPNSTLKDMMENFHHWYQYFLEYVDSDRMLTFYPHEDMIKRDESNANRLSMSHMSVKLDPEQSNDNNGAASVFNQYPLTKTYHHKNIKNNLAKYVRNATMSSINIPIVNFNFGTLYNYLYIRTLFFSFYFGKLESHQLSLDICAHCGFGEFFKLSNNPNDYIDFIYKIGNNESDSVIAKIFKQIKLYTLLDVIKYNLVMTGHLDKNDLTKWTEVTDYKYNLYDICHKIVVCNIIKR